VVVSMVGVVGDVVGGGKRFGLVGAATGKLFMWPFLTQFLSPTRAV